MSEWLPQMARFATWPGVETASAGTNNDAETPLDAELVAWADLVFVMERPHRAKLQQKYRKGLDALAQNSVGELVGVTAMCMIGR